MQMKGMCLDGNIIDNGWIEHLKYENGITNLNAVMILSEIVYWYRPIEIRDEYTGAVKGYRKKFRADKLQKSYDSLAERFGLTKRQVKDACDFLRKRELIFIEFRHVKTKAGIIPNVMFVEPNIGNLKNITGINRIVNDRDNNGEDDGEIEVKREEMASPQASVGYPPLKRNIPPVKTEHTPPLNGTYPPLKRNTNTKITTEIITEKEMSQSVVSLPAATHQLDQKTSTTDRLTSTSPRPITGAEQAALTTIYEQSQTAHSPAQDFVEHVIKKLYSDGNMPYILKMGLTHEEIRSRLHQLKPAHVERALTKSKQATNKELYFAKALLSAIVELALNDLPIDPTAPPPPRPQYQSLPQRDNFEQREYSDEELERFYVNLTE
jgi:hypothetical protein